MALLALAIVTLPFGMGEMMRHAPGQQEIHMQAGHAGHHGELPVHDGSAMDFMVCGACLTLPSQHATLETRVPDRDVGPIAAIMSVEGQLPLPATPPPRS
ncbi:MAG TPA: hypothetical protein VLQ68_02440 [Rhizobiaceae bacterium]|nr:hypothetical protein [Rhizobiaceae bacterium]